MTQTVIEPNKVQLAEKDIEDWLWENPQAIVVGSFHRVEKWIGRQVKLPSGTADLIGACGPVIVVVEVKNVDLSADALTQVCRYAADIESIKHIWNMERLDENLGDDEFAYLQVWKTVVFRGGVTNQLLFEADALGVDLISFQVRLDLDVSGSWRFSKEKRDENRRKGEELARSSMFDEVKECALTKYSEFVQRCQQAQAERERRAEADDESEPSSEN